MGPPYLIMSTLALVILATPGSPQELGNVSVSVTSETSTTTTLSVSTKPTTTSITPKIRPLKEVVNCFPDCTCTENKVTCSSRTMKVQPNMSKMGPNITIVDMSDCSLDRLDLYMLPPSVQVLNVSGNEITTITSSKKVSLTRPLEEIDLSLNPIKSIANLTVFKSFATLRRLYLNETALNDTGSMRFTNLVNLKKLVINFVPMHVTGPPSFEGLKNIEEIHLAGCNLSSLHITDRTFQENKLLRVLDLSENDLIEVPTALRYTKNLQELYLSANSLTSLRSSDFVNLNSLVHLEVTECKSLTKVDEYAFSSLTSLKTLDLSKNPKLEYISVEAFKRTDGTVIQLDVLDLSDNNIVSLRDIQLFESLKFKHVELGGNPWRCSCDLKWLQAMVKDLRSPVHCKSPEKYKDLEISQFFLTTDCEAQESGYHTIIVSGFLLFLLGLTLAVFIQKSDICRRLHWRDQYGSIYYTKASFPAENVQY